MKFHRFRLKLQRRLSAVAKKNTMEKNPYTALRLILMLVAVFIATVVAYSILEGLTSPAFYKPEAFRTFPGWFLALSSLLQSGEFFSIIVSLAIIAYIYYFFRQRKRFEEKKQ